MSTSSEAQLTVRSQGRLFKSNLADLSRFDLCSILAKIPFDFRRFSNQHEHQILRRKISLNDASRILHCDCIDLGEQIVYLASVQTKEVQLREQRGQMIAG